MFAGRSASDPLNCTTNGLPSFTTWFDTAANDGAWFTSRTTTVKLFVVDNAGVPLSVTTTNASAVEGPVDSLVAQRSSPVGDTVIPDGPRSNRKVSAFAGMSVSTPVNKDSKVVPSSVVAPVWTIRGAVFTSRTESKISLVLERGGSPLSVTFTSTRLEEGPSCSVGVQVITPDGLTARPAGPRTSPKASALAGRSASAADKANWNGTDSFRFCWGTTAMTGTELTSPTVTVKELVLLNAGDPPSVTLTRTTWTLGPWDSFGVQVNCPATLTEAPAGPCTRP